MVTIATMEIITLLTVLLYIGAISAACLGIAGRLSQSKRWTVMLGLCAVIGHALLLQHWIDMPGGQNLAFFNLFSLGIWLIAVIVILAAFGKPLENLFLFIFPLALLSILLVNIFPQQMMVDTSADPKQLIHVLFAVVIFSVVGMAGLQATLLGLQQRQLHHKAKLAWLEKFTPLQTTETLLFQMLWIGFFLFTAMLISSYFFYADQLRGALLQKSIFSGLAWILFAWLLIGHHIFGWRGRKALYATFILVVLLLLLYFGSILFVGELQ
jgi:ABC-type uncharacterized transport system permease subunit